MERFNQVLANLAFAVTVLLTFLVVFEQQLEVPTWLQAFGRMHPLLLHLPIGLLLIVTLLVFLRKNFEGNSFDSVIRFLLHLSVFTAAVTALMGLFLSREGGYDEAYLVPHKWLGVATSYAGTVLILFQRKELIFKISLVVAVIVLIFTGHYGSMLTHGDNFILAPLQAKNSTLEINTDQTALEAVVLPLFDKKCASCHNESKAKGRLILTSYEHIIKGGKSGKLLEVGDPDNSLLTKRLLLPLDHKKHMPPKDKPQLTEDELNFLNLWIAQGADSERKLTDYSENDSLKNLAFKIVSLNQRNEPKQQQYAFDFADVEKVAASNNPYRTVFQIAQNEPALQADFFVRQAFDKTSLEELHVFKEQLVSINLAKMPVTDDDLKLLTKFSNLETLNLNSTDINGSKLSDLQELEKLHSLSLSGTKITAAYAAMLGSMKNLKKVFIWNTAITSSEAKELKKRYPAIEWETGYMPDVKEVLQLSAPLMLSEQVLKPDESIELKASLPGTIIRYTTDGSIPDSVSGKVYVKPIETEPYQVVKAIALKDGWKKSNIAEFIVFRSGYKPSRAELKTSPDKKYPGDGVNTFTDNKKGSPDFFRDPTWIAFREGPLEVIFYFDDLPAIGSITLSHSKTDYAMTMPPAEIEVWGGEDEQHLTFLHKVIPAQPTNYFFGTIEGVELKFPQAKRKCYKIIAKPLQELPAFLKSKEKGWLMVDEIFFN